MEEAVSYTEAKHIVKRVLDVGQQVIKTSIYQDAESLDADVARSVDRPVDQVFEREPIAEMRNQSSTIQRWEMVNSIGQFRSIKDCNTSIRFLVFL